MGKTKKLRPGVGAKASLLTRFIHPRQNNPDKQHRTEVVLIARKEIIVNKKLQQCYTFSFADGDDTAVCHAVASHVKVLEEGKRDDLFDDPGPEDDRVKESPSFKEPKTKWRNSKAKRLLYSALMEGTVPMEDTMPMEDIYLICPEFALYSFDKFKDRLQRLRKKINQLDSRAEADLAAFNNYKSNHEPALFSHKGYIQWQGSTAQEFLWDDLEDYLNNPETKPKDLWLSRPEYQKEFPLEAFRDKMKQEIRTAKYLRTLKQRALEKEKKKKG